MKGSGTEEKQLAAALALEHLAKGIAEMKSDVPEIIVEMKTDAQI